MSNEAGIYSAPLTLGLLDDLQDSKEDHSKEEKAKIEVLERRIIQITEDEDLDLDTAADAVGELREEIDLLDQEITVNQKKAQAASLAKQCALLLRDKGGEPFDNLTEEYFRNPETSFEFIREALDACQKAIFPKDSKSRG